MCVFKIANQFKSISTKWFKQFFLFFNTNKNKDDDCWVDASLKILNLFKFSVLTLCALTEGMETDYCNMDATRCDKDGKYKHMWATGYEDFIVRDVMDKTLETIQTEPEVALRRAEETLQAFPNRQRNLINH